MKSTTAPKATPTPPLAEPLRRVFVCMLIATGLACALPQAAVASLAAGSCGGGSSAMLVNLYTFHIEAEPAQKTYRQGEKVKVFVTVHRTADQDPAGEGNPTPRPVEEPAADVTVGAALWSEGSSYTWDTGRVTDEEGKATLLIPLQKDFEPGWARIDVVAEKVHFSNNGCPDIREYGYYSNDRFVKVVPR